MLGGLAASRKQNTATLKFGRIFHMKMEIKLELIEGDELTALLET